MGEIKGNLAQAATSLSDGASDVVDDLRKHAEDALHAVQHRVRRVIRVGSPVFARIPAASS